MKAFWKREHPHDLVAELRDFRPEPREEFVRQLAGEVRRTQPERASRIARFRPASAVGVSVVLLIAAGIFGGVAYSVAGGSGNSGSGNHNGSTASGTLSSSNNTLSSINNTNTSSPNAAEPHPNAAQHEYHHDKVVICHHGRTIRVSPSAVPAHLRHGDTLGPCPHH